MNNDFDVEKAVREYLPEIVHMSLATSADNKPWVCEVHFVFDDDLNLYFRSRGSTRHSQEIAANPNVAGNIVVQHAKGENPRGVYFEGKAERMQNVDEKSPAYIEYCKRLDTGPEILEDAASGSGHNFYKITVTDWYVFDARDSKPSQKYHWPRKG